MSFVDRFDDNRDRFHTEKNMGVAKFLCHWKISLGSAESLA